MGCCAGPCAYGFTAFITFAASVLSLLFYLISFWDFKGISLFEHTYYSTIQKAELSLIDRRIQAAGWFFVLTYQAILTCYALVAAYIKSPMYGSIRAAMSPVVQLLIIVANCGLIAWIFLLDPNIYFRYGIIGLFIAFVSAHFAMTSFSNTFETIHNYDVNKARTCDYVTVHILINAGLGFLTSWSFCIALNHVTSVLAIETNMETEHILYINLGVVFLYITTWFWFDLLYFVNRTFYVYSPYLVCLGVSAAILWEGLQQDHKSLVLLLTAIAVGVIWFMTILKLIITCIRRAKEKMANKMASYAEKTDVNTAENGDASKTDVMSATYL